MSEVTHIERSQLPWRPDDQRTECGRDATTLTTESRDAFIARFHREGQQRMALTTCMTCLQTAQRHRPWNESPSECMSRYAARVSFGGDDDRLLDRELRAIEALVKAHRDEFDQLLSGLAETSSLDDRRRQSRRPA